MILPNRTFSLPNLEPQIYSGQILVSINDGDNLNARTRICYGLTTHTDKIDYRPGRHENDCCQMIVSNSRFFLGERGPGGPRLRRSPPH